MSKLKNKQNEADDSDDDDEDDDYVPDGLNESNSNDEDENLENENESKPQKRKFKNKNSKEDEDSESDDFNGDDDIDHSNGSKLKEKSECTDDKPLEFDKKKADDLWSSFLKDVKPKTTNSSCDSNKYKTVENKAEVKTNIFWEYFTF
jgi:hypothetical protein